MHYVVVRGDLPHGAQVAQTIHAVGESHGGMVHPPGTVAVALAARDREHLVEIHGLLDRKGIPCVLICECDGEPMAIGVRPTQDRVSVRRALSSLPLVR